MHWSGCEGRDQELLNPGGEARSIDRPVDHAGRCDAIVPRGRDEGQRLPMAMRDLVDQWLASFAPAMRAGHVGFCPGFIEKDQAPGISPFAPIAAPPMVVARHSAVDRR